MFTSMLKMLRFQHFAREPLPNPVQQLEQVAPTSAETENTMGQELSTKNQAEATAVTEYRVTDDVRLGDAWKKICEICRTHASRGGSGLRVKWVSVGIDPASSDPAEASRNQAIAEYLVAHMRDSGLYVRNYYGSPDSQDFHVSWKRH